jgi:FdhE protein
LQFLERLTLAQHDIQRGLPTSLLPPVGRINRALEHGMPPLSCASFEPDAAAEATVKRLLKKLAEGDLPEASAAAIRSVLAMSPQQRCTMMADATRGGQPADDVARRALVAAGLQVHLTRVAAMLTADDLEPVAGGVCPACGSMPMTSCVVGWPKAHNTRFCACSMCGTMWNVVRVKCVLCNSTGGISYHTVEGQSDTVKAETCDGCRSYVKILYQVNDPLLEPLADDVATLGLDMLMAKDGWKRGGHNPFLLGY